MNYGRFSCGSRSAPGEQGGGGGEGGVGGVEQSPVPLLPRAKVETDAP